MTGALSFLLVLSVAAGAVPNTRRNVAVVMEKPDQHIPDFTLTDRLHDALTMYAGKEVVLATGDSILPPAPNAVFDLERLINWGAEAGARYIIYLQIDSRKIITAKRWSIPLIFSRYVVEGHLEGAYSLVDIQHRKLINTWNLEIALEGSQQLQVFDDYRDDPDLHIPAPRKIGFLRKLEDLAAAEIIRNVTPNMRGR